MLLALVAKTCDAVVTTRHIQQRMRKRIGYKGPFIVYGIVAVGPGWPECPTSLDVLSGCERRFGRAAVCNILLLVT